MTSILMTSNLMTLILMTSILIFWRLHFWWLKFGWLELNDINLQGSYLSLGVPLMKWEDFVSDDFNLGYHENSVLRVGVGFGPSEPPFKRPRICHDESDDYLFSADNSIRLSSPLDMTLESTFHPLSTFGKKAFSYSAPRCWNALPRDLRVIPYLDPFKAQLKHHLFSNFDAYLHSVNPYTS